MRKEHYKRFYIAAVLFVGVGIIGIWAWYAARPTVYTPAVMYRGELYVKTDYYYIPIENDPDPPPGNPETISDEIDLEETYISISKQPFQTLCPQTQIPVENGMANEEGYLNCDLVLWRNRDEFLFYLDPYPPDRIELLDWENRLLYRLRNYNTLIKGSGCCQWKGNTYTYALPLGPEALDLIEERNFTPEKDTFRLSQEGTLIDLNGELEEGETGVWKFAGKKVYVSEDYEGIIIEVSPAEYWYLMSRAFGEKEPEYMGVEIEFKGKQYRGYHTYTGEQFAYIQEEWGFKQAAERTENASFKAYEDCPVYMCEEGYPDLWWPDTIIVEVDGLDGSKQYVPFGEISRRVVFPKKDWAGWGS